jgi:hypothetical protein
MDFQPPGEALLRRAKTDSPQAFPQPCFVPSPARPQAALPLRTDSWETVLVLRKQAAPFGMALIPQELNRARRAPLRKVTAKLVEWQKRNFPALPWPGR